MSNRDFIRIRKALYKAEVTRSLPEAEKGYRELLDLLFSNMKPPDIGLAPFLRCLTARSGVSAGSFPYDLMGRDPYLDRLLIDEVRYGGDGGIPIDMSNPGADIPDGWIRLFLETGPDELPADRIYPLLDLDAGLKPSEMIHRILLCRRLIGSKNRDSPAAYSGMIYKIIERPELHRPEILHAATALITALTAAGKYHRQPRAEGLLERLRRTEPSLISGLSIEDVIGKIPFFEEDGILPVQFMFRGDPMRSGAGNSGGLGTLLLNLGNSLAGSPRTAGVITVAVYDTHSAAYPFVPIEFPHRRHALVRLPICIGGDGYHNLLDAQTRIEIALGDLSRALLRHIPPERVVYHLRYLDPASVAAARAGESYGIPRVLTLTPDPHRLIGNEDGPPGLEQLGKILAGDELVSRAHGIVGIGRHSIGRSLIPYFPVLESTEGRRVQGIDEGIRLSTDDGREVTAPGFTDGKLSWSITEEYLERPLLLNVGRLHPAKGQETLVRGWSEYGLWKQYNLVLIGGDLEAPSPPEAEFLRWLDDYMDQSSHLRGRLAHFGARPNDEVRRIQRFLGKNTNTRTPHAYVCPSRKEEFGISILEAMSAGMVVFAPVLGGASEYMRHRINGYLIDTSGPEAVGRELRNYLVENRLNPLQMEAVRKLAEETVRLRYSLEKISGDFIDFYCRLGEE